jgi:hypothetical protein
MNTGRMRLLPDRPPSGFLPGALAGALLGVPGLIILGLLTLALGEPMRAHSDALATPAAPLGILSLQFACAADSAQSILAGWNAAALAHARTSLYWDMAFAPAYGILLAALSERLAIGGARSGLAWLPLAAAAADGLENVLHLALIAAGAPGIAPAACVAALSKWALLSSWVAAAATAGLGWLWRLIRRQIGRAHV